MKRIFVCLLVAFSLVFVPVVHAAGLSCPDTGCTLTDQASKEKKQDDDKLAGTGHHCCCQFAADCIAPKTAHSLQITSSAFIIAKHAHLASITVGPLLEPPSLA